MARPTRLEERLGHRFRSAKLLEQALTHRSHGVSHNERLEFLGDSVLGCVVAEELCRRHPGLAEGELSRLRSSLVRREALARTARELELQAHLRLGEGELASGGAGRPSILADCYEALVGAAFLDGGYDAARSVVVATLGPAMAALDPAAPAKDAKTRLQELLQAKRRPLPEYRVVSSEGAAHARVFEVSCTVSSPAGSTSGSGRSRRDAEQQAAARMLERMQSS